MARPMHDRRLRRAGWLLGVALGGFFDGILLHQVLQWHHLLSGVAALRDLRTQVMADGLFHLLMYGLALAGLWQLAAAREAIALPGAARRLGGDVLLGFGAWHVLDIVLNHWLLALHRTRMDVADPLVWDLGWLAVFGLLPLILAYRLRKGGGGAGAGGAVLLAMAVVGAGVWSVLPPRGPTTAAVWLPGGSAPAAVFEVAERLDGRLLAASRAGDLWLLSLRQRPRAPLMREQGAWVFSGSALPAACVAWAGG